MFSNEWLSLLIAGEILENDETTMARREADRWWWYDQNHFEDNESASPKDTAVTWPIMSMQEKTEPKDMKRWGTEKSYVGGQPKRWASVVK